MPSLNAHDQQALQASVFAILGIETDVRCVLDANERTTLCNEVSVVRVLVCECTSWRERVCVCLDVCACVSMSAHWADML